MDGSGRLSGKVAVVTGAGSKGGVGTGAAIAIRFAQEGCRVVVLNRSADTAAATAVAIDRAGGQCATVLADIGEPADCRRAASEAVGAYGQVDILVNNAARSAPDSIADGPEDVWDAVMDVKLKGAVRMARHLLPHISSGGSIINISSIAGIRPPLTRLSYSVGNGALFTLTHAMAIELGPRGIRANCIVPGQVWTPMAHRALSQGRTPEELAEVREKRRRQSLLEAEGTAWDVANAALFFASDDSQWVTGQTIVVDGGFTLRGNQADVLT